ncbi:hypothetical protein F5Y16DRAFT_402448 [Xylariaceae sp. FL0255]|nr:hypothetical protein F5Y16DRAFT_402448 [Xylariaceae sp. FL0255]
MESPLQSTTGVTQQFPDSTYIVENSASAAVEAETPPMKTTTTTATTATTTLTNTGTEIKPPKDAIAPAQPVTYFQIHNARSPKTQHKRRLMARHSQRSLRHDQQVSRDTSRGVQQPAKDATKKFDKYHRRGILEQYRKALVNYHYHIAKGSGSAP